MIGRTYVVTSRLLSLPVTATIVRLNLTGVGVSIMSLGVISFVFNATLSNHSIIFQLASSGDIGAESFDLDDVTCFEVPGAHAVAPADNQRPLLTMSGAGQASRFNGVDDWLELRTANRIASAYLAAAFQTTDTKGVLVGHDSGGLHWCLRQHLNSRDVDGWGADADGRRGCRQQPA